MPFRRAAAAAKRMVESGQQEQLRQGLPADRLINQSPARTVPPASGSTRGGVLLSDSNPVVDGSASPGTASAASRGDHVHPSGGAGVQAYIDFTNASAPSTPASGKTRIYTKTDKAFYQKDDAGAETALSGGGGGGTVTVFRAVMSGTQGILNGTPTKIAFDAEQVDTGASYDPTTNYRWTPPAGPIQVTLSLEYTSDAGNTAQALIYKNGANVASSYSRQAAGSSVSVPPLPYYDVANGTDYYEAYAAQFSGGTLTINNGVLTIFQGIAHG